MLGPSARRAQRRLNTALGLILSEPSPSPDLKHRPSYCSESVVEVLHGFGEYRAVLTHDGQSLFRVRIEHWDTSAWGDAGVAQWLDAGGTTTIVDTLERARLIAAERLRVFTSRADEP